MIVFCCCWPAFLLYGLDGLKLKVGAAGFSNNQILQIASPRWCTPLQCQATRGPSIRRRASRTRVAPIIVPSESGDTYPVARLGSLKSDGARPCGLLLAHNQQSSRMSVLSAGRRPQGCRDAPGARTAGARGREGPPSAAHGPPSFSEGRCRHFLARRLRRSWMALLG